AIRRFVSSSIPAFVGGLLYGFSPAIMAQSLGHPQLTLAFIPPLLLIALHHIVIEQRWSFPAGGVLLGGLFVAQLYSGEELRVEAAGGTVAAVVLLGARHREAIRPRLRYLARTASVAAAVFLVFGAPFVLVQFLGPQRVTSGVLQPSGIFVTDLVNFVLPT